MIFLRLVRAEIAKLREPVTLLALLGAPSLVGVLVFLGLLRATRPLMWAELFATFQQVWAMMLFPLSVVAFVAFVAQIEHRGRAWDHILALPVPKSALFAAKALVAWLCAMALYPLFMLAVLAGGLAGGLAGPHGPVTGPAGVADMAPTLAMSAAAGGLMIAIQLWVSLRFTSFIVPILLGGGGWAVMMIALAFERVDDTRYWPWALPFRVIMSAGQFRNSGAPEAGQDVQLALTLGLAGGAAVLAAMVIDLSRREAR